MAKDLPSSKSLRAGLRATDKPDRWDSSKRGVRGGYPPEDVQRYCVRHLEWQTIRLSMKGKDTCQKLQILEAWWDKHWGNTIHFYPIECQVGNYLGALRRGGQLNDDNQVRKAR